MFELLSSSYGVIRVICNRVMSKQLGIIARYFFVSGDISERSLIACEVALPHSLSYSVPVCNVRMRRRVASTSSHVIWNSHTVLSFDHVTRYDCILLYPCPHPGP